MRLAAQMKGGFYPAHEDAIALAASFLRPPNNQPFSILDPCAGEGAAIRQLGDLLGCRHSNTYAIELDEERAATIQAALSEAKVLAPASFFDCRASRNSFSFIWLNPPFDDSYGKHRVEQQFLVTATEWLMPGGVMALVCPEDVVAEYSEARRHFAVYYDDCRIAPFPGGHRRFSEVIVFGRKRAKPHTETAGHPPSFPSALAGPKAVYELPSGPGPRIFQKVAPTEPELKQMLDNSPLRRHLTLPPEATLPSPPLPLGMGHIALLLASGQLDGVVHADGQLPHVVRGTSRKHEYLADVTEVENADGSTTTKTTIAERIELIVRTVDQNGKIRTYLDTDVKDG